MAQQGDYGFGPNGRKPRTQPPATPPQFQREAPQRQDGTRPSQPQYAPVQAPQPAFTPGYPQSPQPPRAQYPPPQPAWQQPYQPQQQYAPGPAPRKKRRVFLWVFLAIQVLFIVLIITQVAAHPAGPTAAQQAAQQCANHGWYPLFKSQADCDQHYAVALNDAGNVGKGIGVVVILVAWMITDFFLGLGYGIYRLASRR